MEETQQLIYAGMQPCHLVQYHPQCKPNSIPVSPAARAAGTSEEPSTYDLLVEKLLRINKHLVNAQDLRLPYIGPRTYQQFLECFCEIFAHKHTKAVTERENLSKAVAALSTTRKQAEEMRNTLKELKQQHSEASSLSEQFLHSLTLKSCQLEKLKAHMGQSSSVLNAMQMVNEQERQLIENDEDDEELLTLFIEKQTSRLETLLAEAKERVHLAELEENEAKTAMMNSKESALRWHSKIDRNAIDQIKTLNNPPQLVGTIMELMLTLLKQHRAESQTTLSSDGSSSSTPGHVSFISKRRKSVQTAKLDKEQWNAIQIAIGDSQRFLDLLNGLQWEDGLSADAVNLILSKLAIPGKNVPIAVSDSKVKKGLITVSMARHAAESAANMCAFAVSIVEYNDSFKPYKIAAEQLQQ